MARKVILYVDDQPSEALVDTLVVQLDVDVIHAKNGEEAIEIAFREQPDIIIMDIMMPIMDGYEASRIIKSSSLLALTPIIVLTAKTSEMDRDRAFEMGVDNFFSKADHIIMKPVDLDSLINKIRRLIN